MNAHTKRRPLLHGISTGGIYLVLVLIAIICLFPFSWIVLSSFKSPMAVISSEQSFFFTPTMENYIKLLNNKQIPFPRYFRNSIIISLSSTALSVSLAALAGYSLSRIKPRGTSPISIFILSMRMLPPIVLVIPLYIIYNRLGWLDKLFSLILPYTAMNLPLATWMLKSFFTGLPKALEEVAIVDGASSFKAFTSVILPLTLPGLSATAVYSFSLAWNDFLIALPLTTRNAIPLPVLASIVRTDEGIEWATVGCIVVIMIIPTLLFTFFSQKNLISGLASGAVKE